MRLQPQIGYLAFIYLFIMNHLLSMMYVYIFFPGLQPSVLQPVPEEMRLEIIIGM